MALTALPHWYGSFTNRDTLFFSFLRAEREDRVCGTAGQEGTFSSFRSQHLGNHKVECISFVLIPAFNVPGFPQEMHVSLHRDLFFSAGPRSDSTLSMKLFLWILVALFGYHMLTYTMWGVTKFSAPLWARLTSLVSCLYFWDIYRENCRNISWAPGNL